jgi:zinc/manganese transport system permease protein
MIELMLPPFAACLILISIHSYLGLHVIAREVIFVDLSLAQMAALGATIGLLLNVDRTSWRGQAMALLFTAAGAAIFASTRTNRHKGRVPHEAIIGIVYVVATAATLLVAEKAPRGEEAIHDILVGNFLWVTWKAIGRLAVAYLILGVLLFLLRRRYETISFEPARAESEGWRIRWWDFSFYLIFGVVITFSVPIAGVLLVFTFLVVPAVTAFLFTRRPGVLTIISWTSGALASAVGLYLSFRYDLPTGPLIVCVFGLMLILAGLVYRIVRARVPEAAPDAAAH